MKFNSILYDKVKVTVLDDLSFDENDEKIKTLLKKRQFNPLILSNNEYIFFEEMIFDDEKSMFDVVVNTDMLDVLYLKRDHFMNSIYSKINIKKKIDDMTMKKKKKIVKLMANIIKTNIIKIEKNEKTTKDINNNKIDRINKKENLLKNNELQYKLVKKQKTDEIIYDDQLLFKKKFRLSCKLGKKKDEDLNFNETERYIKKLENDNEKNKLYIKSNLSKESIDNIDDNKVDNSYKNMNIISLINNYQPSDKDDMNKKSNLNSKQSYFQSAISNSLLKNGNLNRNKIKNNNLYQKGKDTISVSTNTLTLNTIDEMTYMTTSPKSICSFNQNDYNKIRDLKKIIDKQRREGKSNMTIENTSNIKLVYINSRYKSIYYKNILSKANAKKYYSNNKTEFLSI